MTGPLSRRAALLGGGAALVSTGAASAQLLSGLRNALPLGGFSVSGKSGTFIKQVASRKMTPAGPAARTPWAFRPASSRPRACQCPRPRRRSEPC